jgi:Domain of unknown function (DUF1772)
LVGFCGFLISCCLHIVTTSQFPVYLVKLLRSFGNKHFQKSRNPSKMPSTTAVIQTLSISVSLIASGGIATLSLFDVSELKSQPASRSLPSVRWLFSRGSHIFPQAAFISSIGFGYLAFANVQPGRSAAQLLRVIGSGGKFNGYLAAALLCLGIGPFTTFVMIPTNFELIEMNEQLGGVRSAKSDQGNSGQYERSANDSVSGKGEAAEFTDLSGPQSQTPIQATAADDEKMNKLLSRFSILNLTRAGLIGGGGLLGLLIALE